MKKTGILLLTIIFFSCASRKENSIENIYWVNSAKVNCGGVVPMACLEIQRGETIFQNNWELFYSDIVGFDYQPGFIYKLNIKEVHFDNVPADASSIKYTLLKVLEKEKDKRFEIHDIWILESLPKKDSLNLNNIKKTPQIEINVTKMTFFGTNGCNNISGSIKKLDDTIIEFYPLAETRMACPNMETPTQFSLALTETMTYKKIKNKLVFYNKEGIDILVFKKAD